MSPVIRYKRPRLYALGQMLNMDQPVVRFDMPPNRTNEIKGSKQVCIKTTKAEKRGFTVALCAAADGSKLPAFLIFKERTGEIPRRVRQHLQIPANVHVTATRNGWMTRDQVLSWTQRVLGPSETRRLLLLDNYATRKAAVVRAALDEQDVDLVHVPADCTALAQPIDISIVKPFKINETFVCVCVCARVSACVPVSVCVYLSECVYVCVYACMCAWVAVWCGGGGGGGGGVCVCVIIFLELCSGMTIVAP